MQIWENVYSRAVNILACSHIPVDKTVRLKDIVNLNWKSLKENDKVIDSALIYLHKVK